MHRYTGYFWSFALFCMLFTAAAHSQQEIPSAKGGLRYKFDKPYGTVEVGGKFAGLEFRQSRPLPSRVSFYYPFGNIVDIAASPADRDRVSPFALGIQVGDNPRKWLGREAWTQELSPHTVTFTRRDGELDYRIRYDMVAELPGYIFSFVVRNRSANAVPVIVYTHFRGYFRDEDGQPKDSVNSDYDPDFQYAYLDPQPGVRERPGIMIECAGDPPSDWSTVVEGLAPTDSGTSNWLTMTGRLDGQSYVEPKRGHGFIAFEFKRTIAAGDSLMIVQPTWSGNLADRRELASKFQATWRHDAEDYNSYVDSMATRQSVFVSGDKAIDRSAVWSKGVLAANQHLIRISSQPMEYAMQEGVYNSEIALRSSIGSGNFDLNRLFNAIRFISDIQQRDSSIGKSVYWSIDQFEAGYTRPDDWTNLWFIIANASYLRHSSDTASCERWYNLVTKALEDALTQKTADNLMAGGAPDWWRTGHIAGAHVYPTVLMIRALRDYNFLSVVLRGELPQQGEYEALADSMEQALGNRLWDDSAQYLLNYGDTGKDPHLFSGSLLAPSFGVLDAARSARLVATAGRQLLRAQAGVMNVVPADFDVPAVGIRYGLSAEQAGAPYTGLNGGIWSQANVWYAWALQSVGRTDDALKIIADMTTVDGVMKTPNGLPVIFESRAADPQRSDFGTIGRASSSIAAGLYLEEIYRLAGFADNPWNLSLTGSIPTSWKNIRCTYAFGTSHTVTVTGKAGRLQSFKAGKQTVPSMVLPVDAMTEGAFTVQYGALKSPYLEQVNAILHHAELNRKGLHFDCSAFEGHDVTARVVSTAAPRHVTVNGVAVKNVTTTAAKDGAKISVIRFTAGQGHQVVDVQF